jgi:hypothetical protein
MNGQSRIDAFLAAVEQKETSMNDRFNEMITERGMIHDSELYEISEAVAEECAELIRNSSPDAARAILDHFGLSVK